MKRKLESFKQIEKGIAQKEYRKISAEIAKLELYYNIPKEELEQKYLIKARLWAQINPHNE